MREIAHDIAGARAVLFLGRHVGYPIALEGALKLKELAYMHAEGFPAGELKHGPIALIEDDAAGRDRDALTHRTSAAAPEDAVQRRRGEGARRPDDRDRREAADTEARALAADFVEVPTVPTLLSPFVTTVPLQVLAAAIAQERGYDIDKPRNLAKSVTVE